jgi:proteic killer suppression protein
MYRGGRHRWHVEIAFADDSFGSDCNDFQKLVGRYNKQRAKLLRRRLDDLRAAPTLEVMRSLPGRCHELKTNRAGQLSVDLDGPYRLIFKPSHNPLPVKADGGLDWSRVTRIVVIEVVDTHE